MITALATPENTAFMRWPGQDRRLRLQPLAQRRAELAHPRADHVAHHGGDDVAGRLGGALSAEPLSAFHRPAEDVDSPARRGP